MSRVNGGQERAAQEDSVDEALMACVFHWRMRDVPDARIEEMQEELETHLQEAVRDGRSVESVVGKDPVAFAEEWAKEAKAERSILGWGFEFAGALSFGVVFTAVVYHVFRWSLTFEVEAWLSIPVVVILWSAIRYRTSGMARKDSAHPWWMRWALALMSLPVIFAPAIIAWAITGDRDTGLFEWNWVYTVVALVATVILDRLGKRSVGQK